ncbi:MAG: 30S ribosomal protein THX [Prolixibacteraceae bacterium]|nr:30S ribosomal protein THX [Prolixibacteraceae bacterium]MBN2774095.1 30S ribosomal protein THX [Prolixibacteraceae bacterium]
MGKGDRKTRRGKLFMGSYGVRRPKPSTINRNKRKEAVKDK